MSSIKLWRILAGVSLITLTSCDSNDRTVESIRSEIANFESEPDPVAEQKIRKSFSDLDARIAKLKSDGRTAEAAELESVADSLRSDYRAARAKAFVQNAKDLVEGIGDAIQESAKPVGESIKDAAGAVGDIFRPSPSPTPVPQQP